MIVAEAVGVVVGGRSVAVIEGVGVDVKLDVAVSVIVAVFVSVGKIIETGVRVWVAVIGGLRVIVTFGTHRDWPTLMLYRWDAMQLANCNSGMLML